MEKIRIFVTGGTGFIGKHFLRQLKSWQGEADIYVLLRKEIDFDDRRFIKLKGDLLNIEEHAELLRSCDYVFHLAANVNFFKNGSDDERVNFESTKKIIDILSASSKLKNFIFISSIGAVDRSRGDDCLAPLNVNSAPSPTSNYGKSKLKSEEYLKQSKIPFTIIRPTWVYGRYMRDNSHINKFVSMTYAKSFISKFNFPGKVSLIYVADLVTALVSCIENVQIVGKTYFATTESRSIGNIFSVIYKDICGEPLKQMNIPSFIVSFVRKCQPFLPLTVSNLFIDYLFADGKDFVKDFNIQKYTIFEDGVVEVIKTNNSIFKQVSKYNKVGSGFFGAWLKLSLYPMNFFREVLPKKGILLDLGCGEGMLSNYLAQTIAGLRVVGVDKDAKKIEQATKVAGENAEFKCMDMEALSVDNVQAIVMNDVLHHHSFDKQKGLLEKAVSMLETGGVLVLKEVDKNDSADSWWSTFWDKKLYPNDTLNYRTSDEWVDLVKTKGVEFEKKFFVHHFWPASRTVLVFRKSA